MHIAFEHPGQPDIIALITELDAYQGCLYPPEACYTLDISALSQPQVRFAVARDAAGVARGCAAVVLGADYGEIKRMYVQPALRGQGVAALLLQQLTAAAQAAGCPALMLETGPLQPAALAFYTAQGFARCAAFGDYPGHPLSVFMHKPLADDAVPAGYQLQPCVADDFEALLVLRLAAMRPSLEAIGRFDPERARARLAASFQPADTRWIVRAGQRIGFLARRQLADCHYLDHLYVQPGLQGQGVGGAVLQQVQAEAAAAGLPLCLGALRGSAANLFYLRHGFVPTHEEEWDIYYRWQAATKVTKPGV
ncbi:GNAT family N-acetyltransferase [Vogesella sp. DC21W]|uniref:GNAT family N-acetyltransferase n=1 Tax=Vogesella aquatica TaxID=2984206 RepID=A0ABT5IYT6_9NEIS|nr:GNAT family N-acetyltransferase [Vogesella aquatica]MDC7716779.1 GNAT family N-acetyltransferase [Vogesella aquatica]